MMLCVNKALSQSSAVESRRISLCNGGVWVCGVQFDPVSSSTPTPSGLGLYRAVWSRVENLTLQQQNTSSFQGLAALPSQALGSEASFTHGSRWTQWVGRTEDWEVYDDATAGQGHRSPSTRKINRFSKREKHSDPTNFREVTLKHFRSQVKRILQNVKASVILSLQKDIAQAYLHITKLDSWSNNSHCDTFCLANISKTCR